MAELKKPPMTAAVSITFASVCMLIVFVLSATRETRSEVATIIVFFALLVLTAGVIVQWVKYFKKYVDFAIKQKLSRNNKKVED